MSQEFLQAFCLATMVLLSGCKDKTPVMLREVARPEAMVAKAPSVPVPAPQANASRLGAVPFSEADLLRLLNELSEKDHETGPSTTLSEGERLLVSELTR